MKSTTRVGELGHRLLEVPAGAEIFREGELGTEMYIIQEGEIEILRRVGGEQRRLALLEKGDFFGEMSLLEDLPRSATARAVSKARLVQIGGATFNQMLRDHPEIAVRIMRKLSRRVREADRQLGREPAPPAAEPEAAAPVSGRLIHTGSGSVLELSATPSLTVGRRDPVTGIQPAVDLTTIDSERSVSRRHAKLQRRGGRLYVVEDIGTTNGTFVNGERIVSGKAVEIGNGDILRFGLVELTYRVL